MRRVEYQAAYETQRLKKVSLPFRDDTVMRGPAKCSKEDFRQPLLRRCCLDQDDIHFMERIDGGFDGYVWKVKTDQEGPFALKIASISRHTVPARQLTNYTAVLGQQAAAPRALLCSSTRVPECSSLADDAGSTSQVICPSSRPAS